MKEIKKQFKLLKYTYQIKTNVVSSLLFFLLGILMMTHSGMNVLGAMYIFLGPLFVIQATYNLLVTGMVLSSPNRKKIELQWMDTLQIVSAVFSSMVILLLLLIMKQHYMAENTSWEVQLVLCGCMVMGLQMYIGFAYKYFMIAMLVLIMSVVGSYTSQLGFLNNILASVFEGKVIFSILFFVGEVALGLGISMLLRRVLYRKAFSKYALAIQLRTEL